MCVCVVAYFLVSCSSSRCRLSASPATGMVGMQENVFLGDFFGCLGILPLATERWDQQNRKGWRTDARRVSPQYINQRERRAVNCHCNEQLRRTQIASLGCGSCPSLPSFLTSRSALLRCVKKTTSIIGFAFDGATQFASPPPCVR